MRLLTDFQKSSVAFALGMGIVVLAVAVKTAWDIEAILLTSGTPLIFYGIWASFALRQERAQRIKAAFEDNMRAVSLRKHQASKIAKKKLEILFGESPNENPLAYVPAPHRGERRVLLPRDHELTKQRILQGREVLTGDEVNERDQWHD